MTCVLYLTHCTVRTCWYLFPSKSTSFASSSFKMESCPPNTSFSSAWSLSSLSSSLGTTALFLRWALTSSSSVFPPRLSFRRNIFHLRVSMLTAWFDRGEHVYTSRPAVSTSCKTYVKVPTSPVLASQWFAIRVQTTSRQSRWRTFLKRW